MDEVNVGIYPKIKRAIDFIIALIGFIVLIPIFLLLIFAIAATTVYILCMNVKMHNMLEWFSISAVIFFINLIIITLVYKLTNNLKFMNRLLKRKGK